MNPAVLSIAGLSVNGVLWVALGTAILIVAFVELWLLPSDAIGEALLLVTSMLPLAVTIVCIDEVLIAASSKKINWLQLVVFAVVGLASGLYFLTQYMRNDEQQKLFKKHGLWEGDFWRKLGEVVYMLSGGAAVLGQAALLVAGGIALIRASWLLGIILGSVGVFLAAVQRGPHWWWNIFWRGRTALVGTADRGRLRDRLWSLVGFGSGSSTSEGLDA